MQLQPIKTLQCDILDVSLSLFPNISFATIGDPHVKSDAVPNRGNERLTQIVNYLNNNQSTLNLNFAVFMGDMADGGSVAQFDIVKGILNNLQIPYYTVCGNHDVIHEGPPSSQVSSTILDYCDSTEKWQSTTNASKTQISIDSNIHQEGKTWDKLRQNCSINTAGSLKITISPQVAYLPSIVETIDFGSATLQNYIALNDILLTYMDESPQTPFNVNEWIRIDDEILLITNINIPSKTLTVTRGEKNTNQVEHLANATIFCVKDLSGYNYIEFWLMSNTPNITVNVGFGIMSIIENTFPINITNTTTGIWQKIRLNISSIPDTNKDRLTKFGLIIPTSTKTPTVLHIDNIMGTKDYRFENYFGPRSHIERKGQYQLLFVDIWTEQQDGHSKIHWDFDYSNQSINKNAPTIIYVHGPPIDAPDKYICDCCNWGCDYFKYAIDMQSELSKFTNLVAVYFGHVHRDLFLQVGNTYYICNGALIDSVGAGGCNTPATNLIGYTQISGTTKNDVLYQNLDFTK